jgi:pilus assembly protein TadC
MFGIAVDSEVSGAAAVEQLGAVADQERRELEAALDRRLQRLPVAMLFPLALLILPGFLLVAVVPAVVGGIARLGI